MSWSYCSTRCAYPTLCLFRSPPNRRTVKLQTQERRHAQDRGHRRRQDRRRHRPDAGGVRRLRGDRGRPVGHRAEGPFPPSTAVTMCARRHRRRGSRRRPGRRLRRSLRRPLPPDGPNRRGRRPGRLPLSGPHRGRRHHPQGQGPGRPGQGRLHPPVRPGPRLHLHRRRRPGPELRPHRRAAPAGRRPAPLPLQQPGLQSHLVHRGGDQRVLRTLRGPGGGRAAGGPGTRRPGDLQPRRRHLRGLQHLRRPGLPG